MATTVEQLLEHRARRVAAPRRSYCAAYSLLFHGAVIAAVWFVPELFATPPEPVEYVSVMVVPPQMLGIEQPPIPPPPKKVEPPPPEPPPPEPPPPEPPPPEPTPEDVPVLVEKKKRVEKKLPPPTVPQPAPPQADTPPPKRVGSPFGNPLGATRNEAVLGVEDPNFTYGYYLDRVVAAINSNWVRPPMGKLTAKLRFRIQRDGTITDLRVVEPSTSQEFDEAALRAVSSSSPLPPLPKGYAEDDLGINLIVE